jgi:hypothetical protein
MKNPRISNPHARAVVLLALAAAIVLSACTPELPPLPPPPPSPSPHAAGRTAAATVAPKHAPRSEPKGILLDRIVAVVNGSPILLSQVDDEERLLLAEIKARGYTPPPDTRVPTPGSPPSRPRAHRAGRGPAARNCGPQSRGQRHPGRHRRPQSHPVCSLPGLAGETGHQLSRVPPADCPRPHAPPPPRGGGRAEHHGSQKRDCCLPPTARAPRLGRIRGG